jgi:hypothetical protein
MRRLLLLIVAAVLAFGADTSAGSAGQDHNFLVQVGQFR